MIERRTTTCNRDCPDVCRIVAHVDVEAGRVVRLEGDREHPTTQGFLCYRTNHFLPLQYGPQRLHTPLLRKNGVQVPVSWDEALDFLAERLLAIRAESGPAAIFHYRSGGSLGLLKHLTEYFFERFGPVTIKRGDVCSGAGDAAQLIDFGAVDAHDRFDLLNARNIILWGKNVFISSPHLLPVLKEARARGAGLVLVDPVHHRTTTLCDRYVQPRPASDFALAMAVARLLFERDLVDPALERYADNVAELRALALRFSVEQWCARADVPVADAEDLAMRLGPGKPCAILVGWGMGRRQVGGTIVRALDALCTISGNLGVPGGGVSFDFKRRGAFDLSFIRGRAAAPRSICEPLFGPEVLAASDPPIRALWITAGNPAVMLPDSARVAQAIASRELSVVVDPFLTDSGRLATCVLPTTTLLEDDDVLGSYGHHYLGESRPVVPPPPGIKSDLEIAQALAQRVGLGEVMAGSARSWKQRLIARTLGPHGITLDDIATGNVRNPLSAQVQFADRRFATASGRVNLLTAADLPKAVLTPPIDSAYPLLLTALSTERSQSSQWSKKTPGPPVVTVHPDSAARVADGDPARLVSARGSLLVRVKHDPLQRREVALTPKGGLPSEGQGMNGLIDARVTDIGEGASLYDQPVRLEPI